MHRALWEDQEWAPEEKGWQVRLPGGGGSLAVKEGNGWQMMGIAREQTHGGWPSFLKPSALAFLSQPQTEGPKTGLGGRLRSPLHGAWRHPGNDRS